MWVYLWRPVSDMQWPAPDWFHVPTNNERQLVYNIWLSLWIWWPSSWDGMKTYLKMPYAGRRRYSDGSVLYQWDNGAYWSSVRDSSTTSYYLFFRSSGLTPQDTNFCVFGFSIRAFKDTPVTPDSSWTALYSDKIYHNSDLWLISISSDWNTRITIADKNLWATTVYNSWDALSESNCGKYYQRWNNYWFPFTWAVTTSSTQVNASTYWPWNYYESSTFITTYPRDSSDNRNLRWWITQWTTTKSVELQNAYIWEYVPPLPYLCFTANTANSTVKLTKNWSPTSVTLEKSTDWKTRSSYTIWTTITLSNIWDKVYWRNTSETDTGFSTSSSNYYNFSMSGSISASGDTTYLLNKNWTLTLNWNYCFANLFKDCTALTSAPELPATTITQSCYYDIFAWCSSLLTSPSSLPATKLYTSCYQSMFWNCVSLTTVPTLLATTLANYCCAGMFSWCTSLMTPPSLPATSLANYCYYQMFSWCSSLASLPKLPATLLSTQCYYRMFELCSRIYVSTTQTWIYQTPYRIPTTWTWYEWSDSLLQMFLNTWWTFTWTPSANTTYYTYNTLV